MPPPPLAASTLGRPLYVQKNLQGGMRFMTAIGHSKDGVGSSDMDTIINYDLYYWNVFRFRQRGWLHCSL